MGMGPGIDGGLMALLGVSIGAYSFLIFASLSPFMAGLLWTFGVHMAGQKEKNYVSYFGVACLCVLPASIFLGLSGLILSQVNSDPRILIFMLSLLFFCLQSFLSILFGKLIWKATWTQSFKTWMFLLILWFFVFLIFWIVMFSYGN
tara:strand:+ start:289 stop:729 length:441 start_codon:yes stop_codon:yes gene_type:complete